MFQAGITSHLWWVVLAQMPLHMEVPSELADPRVHIAHTRGADLEGAAFGDVNGGPEGALDPLAWYEVSWELYTWRWWIKDGVWVCDQLKEGILTPLGPCGLAGDGTIQPGGCQAFTAVLPTGVVLRSDGTRVLGQVELRVRVTRPVVTLRPAPEAPQRVEVNQATWMWASRPGRRGEP